MTFLKYMKWLFYRKVFRYRRCSTCMGTNGHCHECDQIKRNLYKRDWMKWHMINKLRK